MKAVVFHDIGDIRLEDVPEPTLQAPTDAIEAFGRRHSGWIKVELRPAKRTQDGSEEQIHSSPALDRVIADASPYHEARSEKPGHL